MKKSQRRIRFRTWWGPLGIVIVAIFAWTVWEHGKTKLRNWDAFYANETRK